VRVALPRHRRCHASNALLPRRACLLCPHIQPLATRPSLLAGSWNKVEFPPKMLAEMTALRKKDPNFNAFASLRKKYGWKSKYPNGKRDTRINDFFHNHKRSKKVIKKSNALRKKKKK
jgi:hypothetical protein